MTVEQESPTTSAVHPYRRFVAIGDSFTEGIGDPEPTAPGGFRGWADRVAEVLALSAPDLAYANLAIRGRLLRGIVEEQVDPALALAPDLLTMSAGGNDVIRGRDPDAIAAELEPWLARLTAAVPTVVLFTGVDTRFSRFFRPIRGRTAVYNEHLRTLATRYGARIADQWSLTSIQDPRMWAVDRLHLNPLGHHEIARLVLDVLEVPNDLAPMRPEPAPPRRWREARREDLNWAYRYFGPWLGRRIRRTSSGDGVSAKRPTFRSATGSDA